MNPLECPRCETSQFHVRINLKVTSTTERHKNVVRSTYYILITFACRKCRENHPLCLKFLDNTLFLQVRKRIECPETRCDCIEKLLESKPELFESPNCSYHPSQPFEKGRKSLFMGEYLALQGGCC